MSDCVNCKSLEEKIASLEKMLEEKHPDFDGSYVETIDAWHSDQCKVAELTARIAELEETVKRQLLFIVEQRVEIEALSKSRPCEHERNGK